MACRWSILDYPIWLVNAFLTALAPLGRISLVLALGGTWLVLQTSHGGYHMILEIPEVHMLLAMGLGALVVLLAIYVGAFYNKKKHADEDEEIYQSFNLGFLLAVALGVALAVILGAGLVIAAGYAFATVISDYFACVALSVFIGMACAWVVDYYFVNRVASGTWDAYVIKLRSKTDEVVETVVSELDPVAVAQILSLAGRSDMTAQVLQEMQKRQQKE